MSSLRCAPRRAAANFVGPHDFRQSERIGRLMDEPMAFARVIEARTNPGCCVRPAVLALMIKDPYVAAACANLRRDSALDSDLMDAADRCP